MCKTLKITVTLTEVNKEIEYWQRSVRAITGSGGSLTHYTQQEEGNLKYYETELKKWKKLKESLFE